VREADYTPRPEDLAYIGQLIRTLKPGGIWACPGSLSSFKFNHADKEIILLTGDPEDETNRRTVTVAKALGWRVLTQEEKLKEAADGGPGSDE